MPTSTPPGSLTTVADVHAVLDVAVEEQHLEALLKALHGKGFARVGERGAAPWNFLLACGRVVLDLHVVVLDTDGNGVLGPPERDAVYPAASLAGRGTVGARAVRCIAAEHAVRFHDQYEGDADDRRDVRALCERFGLAVPEQYR